MDAFDEDPIAPPLRPPLHNTSSPRDEEPLADELEKIRQWQEARATRKLRGEYESAVRHLSELINSNLNAPSRLASVRVEGAANTRSSFLGWLIAPHLANAPDAEHVTLGNALHTSRGITRTLIETDIFATVEPRIEASRDVFAKDGDVDLVLRTRERGRFFVKGGTEVGSGEGSATATARIRNVFGGAETFEANVSTGTKTRRAFQASLTAPLTPDLRTRGELAVFGLQRDNSSFASSSEAVHGTRASVRTGSWWRGYHEVSYNAVLRHVGSLTPTASMSMRHAAGQTVKSSVSHSWTRDTRDDRITATMGSYNKITHELAGLGGDASFYKAEAESQLSRQVLQGLSISVATRMGALFGLKGQSTLFPDRFQLGGPTSVRMFRQNSMGPRDGLDSLGGDLYWSAGISAISDLPWKPHWPLKAHAFVNAGRLGVMDSSKSFSQNVSSSFTQPSVSAGLGLIYRLDPIRIELNFGVPLAASRGEGYRRGFQIGMGIDFL